MPPSSAGASSYEDQANSHNHDGYSAALDHGLAAPRVGDGDARHIAMKIIRMGHRKSISPINSYAESNKSKLWRETAARGHPSPLGRISIFRRKGISGRFFTSHLSGQDGAGTAWAGVDRKMRFARRRHYRAMLLRDGMEVDWGRKIEAYVTPLAHDETCVVLLSRDPFINF
jgi:hypothetical protein